jgi:hypothetical protein
VRYTILLTIPPLLPSVNIMPVARRASAPLERRREKRKRRRTHGGSALKDGSLVVSVPCDASSDAGGDTGDALREGGKEEGKGKGQYVVLGSEGRKGRTNEEDAGVSGTGVLKRVDAELKGETGDDNGHPEADEETARLDLVGVKGGDEGGDEAEDCEEWEGRWVGVVWGEGKGTRGGREKVRRSVRRGKGRKSPKELKTHRKAGH